MYEKDTIVSISTGIGEGAIGIVRLSGPASRDMAEAIFSPRGKGVGLESFRLSYGYVVDPEGGEEIDEVLVSYMRAPHTYTREDVVEINCHGGYLAQRKVLELLTGRGARLAEPGEFTRRAFLNGRIDLLEAEAVLGLVKSRSEEALRASARQCSGRASREIGGLRDRALEVLSSIEAGLDFVEEDLEEAEPEELARELRRVEEGLEELLRCEKAGNLLRNGVEVVIVGKPNVGKSSLLNALLKEEKALVAEVPGTTRDAVEGQVTLDGIPFILVDTAGIHKAGDRVEVMGVERSKVKLVGAQVALVVLDASGDLDERDRDILDLTSGKRRIIVGNKDDLGRRRGFAESLPAGEKLVFASALRSRGLKELEAAMAGTARGDSALTSGDAVIMSVRQHEQLKRARRGVREAAAALEKGRGGEIAALALREALADLDRITGHRFEEDLIDAVFSRFCIGK
jgi:tRNA modification GTPase